MFGSQTASRGDMVPFMAKVDEMVENRIKAALSPIPIPRCNPIPPFTFREANETPIKVKIKEANG